MSAPTLDALMSRVQPEHRAALQVLAQIYVEAPLAVRYETRRALNAWCQRLRIDSDELVHAVRENLDRLRAVRERRKQQRVMA